MGAGFLLKLYGPLLSWLVSIPLTGARRPWSGSLISEGGGRGGGEDTGVLLGIGLTG